MDGQGLAAVVEAGNQLCVFIIFLSYALNPNDSTFQIRGQGNTPNLKHLTRQRSLIGAQ